MLHHYFASASICFALLALTWVVPLPADAQEEEEGKTPAMSNQRLGELLAKRFETIEGREGFWIIRLEEEVAPADEGDAPAEDERDPLDDTHEPKDEPEPATEEVVLMVVTDETANRMRIMTPIRKYDPQDEEDAKLAVLLLHANFDRALDAKYAVNGGMLWSCFVHPLGSLTEADLDNALTQVRTLRRNTGTSYSSTDMIFGGGQEVPDEQPPRRPEI